MKPPIHFIKIHSLKVTTQPSLLVSFPCPHTKIEAIVMMLKPTRISKRNLTILVNILQLGCTTWPTQQGHRKIVWSKSKTGAKFRSTGFQIAIYFMQETGWKLNFPRRDPTRYYAILSLVFIRKLKINFLFWDINISSILVIWSRTPFPKTEVWIPSINPYWANDPFSSTQCQMSFQKISFWHTVNAIKPS